MAQLIVRNLDEGIVQELRERAARHGRSAEEEHRQILKEVLQPERPRVSFRELIAQMPEIDEGDLERVDDLGREVRL
jgi:antitoxin FitA